MKKRRKKTERQKAIKRLDALAKEVVFARDKCRCVKCGKSTTLAPAHIFSRRNFSVRWDTDNIICLCYRHHIHWAHKEPILFTEWVKEHLGEKKYNQLRLRANTPVRGQDLKLVEIYLQNELKKLCI